MRKRGKNFEKASSMIEKGKIYQIDEAIELLKSCKIR